MAEAHKISNIVITANFLFLYLYLPSLFAHCKISKFEIQCLWVPEDYISRLQTSLVLLILNGTAEMKLTILAFLYCGEFVRFTHKKPSEQQTSYV